MGADSGPKGNHRDEKRDCHGLGDDPRVHVLLHRLKRRDGPYGSDLKERLMPADKATPVGRKLSFDANDVWRRAVEESTAVIADANRKIADKCKKLGKLNEDIRRRQEQLKIGYRQHMTSSTENESRTLDRSAYLQAYALFTLANSSYRRALEIERAMQALLGGEGDLATGVVSDIIQDPDVCEAKFKNALERDGFKIAKTP